jgi:alkyl sulfatase BDS1-like metallo-beta-lactamase superfamily hydrolase
MGPDDKAAALVRRVIANPNDESAWLVLARELADDGHDREAVVVRVYWFRLAKALQDGQPLDSIMAGMRNNFRTLHRAAARIVER